MPDTTHLNSVLSQSPSSDDTGGFLAALGKRLGGSSGGHPAQMSDADRAEYLAMLRGNHPVDALPDDQAHKLLDTLWSIMVAFVDLGFGIGGCGQIGVDTDGKCDKRAANLVNSLHPETNSNKSKPASAKATGEQEES